MNINKILQGGVRHPMADRMVTAAVGLSVWKVWLDFSRVIPYTEAMDTVMTALVCISFLGCILLQGNSWKTLAGFGAALAAAFVSAKLSGQMVVLFTTLAVLGLKDCDMDRVARTLFTCQLAFFAGNTVWAAGVFLATGEMGVVFQYDSFLKRTVWNLGFIHKNSLGLCLLNLVLLWIWIRFDRIRFWDYIGMLAIAWFQIVLAYCRTAGVIVILCCGVLMLLQLVGRARLGALIKFTAMFATPALAFITYVGGRLMPSKNTLVLLVNRVLTGRLGLMDKGLTYYGVTLFGQPIPELPPELSGKWWVGVCDNVYTYCFVRIGLIWLAVTTIGNYLLARKDNLRVNCFLILWALYGMTEIHSANGFTFFPVLLLSLLLSNRQKKICNA